jgi:hypothetical protein
MNAIQNPELLWDPPIEDQAVTIHTLELAGITVRLDLPVFRDMVHLSILTRDPPTIESLLAVLASSPRMRVLRFEHSDPPISQQLVLPTSQIIRLEYLEYLRLGGMINDVAYLFSHLSIPLTTTIEIFVALEHISNLSFLFFPESTLTKFLSASSFLFLSFDHRGYAQSCRFQGVAFEGSTVYEGRDNSSPALKCLHDIFDLIPTSSPLSDVALAFNHIPVTEREWVGIITHPIIYNVKSLLTCSNNNSFFVALVSRKPPETPYLPNLETLYIPPGGDRNVLTEYIQNYLEARISAGIRLKELRAPKWFAELPECTALLPLVDSFVNGIDDFHLSGLCY